MRARATALRGARWHQPPVIPVLPLSTVTRSDGTQTVQPAKSQSGGLLGGGGDSPFTVARNRARR